MEKMKVKRKVDLVVLSDVHLGTYGCHARELLLYLKSIKAKKIILNGDFIDIWQFSKRYWPKSHMKVIKHLMSVVTKGTKVYYVTGNHDELLRKFEGLKLGSFSIVNKIVLPLDNDTQAWIFHGDVFDVVMQHSKWLARCGAAGYDLLILFNRFANFISHRVLNKGKLSLSKKIKNGVKSAISYIQDFEQTAAEIGIANGYQYVVCGHIHHPQMRTIENEKGNILYLNSGDWVENLTALEYHNSEWKIYHHEQGDVTSTPLTEEEEMDTSELFNNLLKELQMVPSQ
jgi:UDP-2,3-diacylglucosamine pyrophosphatase LpxH